MSVIHAPVKPETNWRLLLFPVTMTGLLTVVLVRLWYIQVVKAPELSAEAARTAETKSVSLAPRGLMYDRHGKLVAGVRSNIVVTVIPDELRKNPEMLPRIATISGVDEKQLQENLRDAFYSNYLDTPILSNIDTKVAVKLAELAPELPGLNVKFQPMRFYPDSTSFTHIMGYVGVRSKADIERLKAENLDAAQFVGKAGIERAYENALMGLAGEERFEVDARRRPIRLSGRDAAIPGGQLTLSIDAGLQKLATQILGSKGGKGSAVAIDPRTGEVLCMVSTPTYDLRIYDGGLTRKEWASLSDEQRRPQLNRAVQTALAPGSTFKVVTAIAAAQSGKWQQGMTVQCNGGYRVGNKVFRCMGRHGNISFEPAMAKSCNTFFSWIGDHVGREAMNRAAEDVGLNQRSGIEIGGEVRGSLPDDRWLARARKEKVWYRGDQINQSLGQGAVAATPLQMANVAALIANNGVNYVPHFVREIRHADGSVSAVTPRELHRVDLPIDFWASLRKSLEMVISSGTARVAQINGISWGGKTGSAEHIKGRLTHGWFIGYAPADNPRIAICVRVEEAGHGGDVAAPVAKQLVEYYLGKAAAKSR